MEKILSSLNPGGTNYVETKTNLGEEAAKSIVFSQPFKGVDGVQRMGADGDKYWGVFSAISMNVFNNEPDKVGKILSMFDEINASDIGTLRTVMYGIEGEDWKLNADGLVESLFPDDPMHHTSIGSGSTMTGEILPSVYMALTPKQWEWADANNFKAGRVDNLIQWPMPSNAKYSTELLKIEEEAYIAMITGKKPIDYFDEFVANWLAAGGEQLTKEANEWFAAQK